MKPTDEELVLIASGVAGASFVALAQLATRETLAENHLWATRAFAAAIPPAISVLLWLTRFPGSRRKIIVFIGIAIALAIAGVTFVVGVGCLFLAVDRPAVIIFSMFSLICGVIWAVRSFFEYTPEEMRWPPGSSSSDTDLKSNPTEGRKEGG